MATPRLALVTGANQGLGLALVEGLAARMRPDDAVMLTGRDPRRVADAVAGVVAAPATRARVEGRVLDVADPVVVADLARELGGVDVVLSNAGARITPDRPAADQVDEFTAVANGGTSAMLRAFAPTLRPGGRFVVVASSLGTLGHLDPRLWPLFDDAPLDEVDAVVASWRAAVHDGSASERGWPEWLNVPSKIAQVAAVRAVASERRGTDLDDGTLVAVVCPGLVDTPASRPWFDDVGSAQTPAQAAAAVLDLVLAEEVDPATYGELVRFGAVLDWHAGSPDRIAGRRRTAVADRAPGEPA